MRDLSRLKGKSRLGVLKDTVNNTKTVEPTINKDAQAIHEANKLGGGKNKTFQKVSKLTPKSGRGLVRSVGDVLG